MRVFLDDVVIEPAPPTPTTFASALAAAKASAERSGRVIVDVQLDGQPVGDAAFLESGQTSDLRGSELRCISAEPIVLVRSTLQEVASLLPSARAAQNNVAELIHAGRLEPAMNKLAEALATWSGVHQAVSSGASLLNIDLDNVQVPAARDGQISLASSIQSLAASLTEIKRTITAQDWAGLADSMSYDMNEQADVWERVLPVVCDHLTKQR